MEKLKTAGIQQPDTAPAMMKAAVLAAPGHFKIEYVSLPEPEPGEVRIKLQGCGVCASNIPMWEGREWFEYPRKPGSPGHEGWGVIDKTGEGVANFETGDLVAALSYKAFAEYDIASGKAVVKLPEELKDQIFLGEPLGCAMNIFRRSDINPGQHVVIIGIGFLGSLLTQLSKNAGANVIAISLRPYALEMAKKMGADETILLRDHRPIIEKVKTITNGKFCERIIEATGKQDPLDLATELTAIRGRLIIAGYHQDGHRTVDMKLWNWRGIDVINAHERGMSNYMQGMRDAVDAVANHKLDPEPLYTHRFSLNELDQAFNTLLARPEGFIKAVVQHEEP